MQSSAVFYPWNYEIKISINYRLTSACSPTQSWLPALITYTVRASPCQTQHGTRRKMQFTSAPTMNIALHTKPYLGYVSIKKTNHKKTLKRKQTHISTLSVLHQCVFCSPKSKFDDVCSCGSNAELLRNAILSVSRAPGKRACTDATLPMAVRQIIGYAN